jgi:hypothetical protein
MAAKREEYSPRYLAQQAKYFPAIAGGGTD